jgi:hypothetical protein
MKKIINTYYTYIYLNPLKSGNFNYGKFHFDFSPFYVGKGCRRRLYVHLNEAKNYKKIEKESTDEEKCNIHKINTINKIVRLGKEPIVFKIKENVSNFEACELEKYLIKLIGRADKKLGPLTNMTDGGDGLPNPSKLTRKKLSDSHKNKNNPRYQEALQYKNEIIDLYVNQNKTIEDITKLFNIKSLPVKKILLENGIKLHKRGSWAIGKTYTEEHRENLSNSLTGRKLSKSHRKNISEGGKEIHKGQFVSEEAKQKNREAHLGKITSESTKKKLSDVSTGVKKSAEHAQHIGDAKRGIPRKEETKQKISKRLTGRKLSKEQCIQQGLQRHGGNNPRAKKVINLDTNQIFDCIKDACTFYNEDYYYIIAACQHKRETCKLGFHWSYFTNTNNL